jgi:hypothetical protein
VSGQPDEEYKYTYGVQLRSLGQRDFSSFYFAINEFQHYQCRNNSGRMFDLLGSRE